MRAFADLMDRLVLTPSRNGKLRMIRDYLAQTPDPDRGWCLAALTGTLDLPAVKPAILRALAAERIDPELFAYSYDYVGDLAETVSLIWPEPAVRTGRNDVPALSEIIATLMATSRSDAAARMAELLDAMDRSERYALVKLATGGLRMGVSARLARQALADLGGRDVDEIEEIWHGLSPPFTDLFAWLEGRAGRPEPGTPLLFRPVMLAHPLDAETAAGLTLADFAVEWKWDGIRIQLAGNGDQARLFSRSGDDISAAFPDLLAAFRLDAVLDGELLVRRPDGGLGSFADLQQRLNRKTVSRRMLADFPVFMRVYDLLMADGEDLRPHAWQVRRERLAQLVERLDPERFDLSPLVEGADWASLDHLRHNPPEALIEGVMLKRRDSAYLSGRPKGPWFKWKAEARTVDAVLLYAQRGHGKRSSFYSDYTFGVWKEEAGRRILVPVGKAYSGFTDEELKRIDKYVRDNTVDRFGPVRAVRADETQGLVLEVAFEGLNRSPRHKSGLAMRFPRISRIRWDKPSAEADTIATLEALLP